MSLIGKIFNSKALEPAGGEYYWIRPDLILLPEYALALHADLLMRNRLNPADAERVLVVADHFCPPASIDAASSRYESVPPSWLRVATRRVC